MNESPAAASAPSLPPGPARAALGVVDFSRQPFVLAWELTRACNLACVHCRAEAQLRRDPRELSTAEGLAPIDEIARFDRPPTLILTGGDPLRRPDLLRFVAHATGRGIPVTLTPAGTPLASREKLAAARDAGLRRVAISLDGSDAARHDAFRQTVGSFGWTLDIARRARGLGIPLQVHSTLCRRTRDDLPALADLAERLGAVVWAVFCLVPTGRAEAADALSPAEYEAVFAWLAERSTSASWDLKLTEGYHYRRYLAERGTSPVHGLGFAGDASAVGRAPKAVNAGNGFCFVSHTGDVCPSGFLPVVAGNVRDRSIVDIYRDHPLFRDLRDPDRLTGRCGGCRYRALCGGSRSRAFAATGDPFGDDPACAWPADGRAA